MSVTILPYVTTKSYVNNSDKKETAATKKTGNSANAGSTGNTSTTPTFDEALNTAARATAALAIDTLVAASKTGAVDSTKVQEFFNQHGIDITVDHSGNGDQTPKATTKTEVDPNPKASDNSGTLKCSKELQEYFEKAAKKYNVDVKFLKSIAKAESNFNPNAVSHCGAVGVMQLMPSTAKGLGVKDSYNPEQNIMGGAKLISGLLKKYNGDKSLALAAYNAGSGNVAKYGGIPPFKETQNYVKKVLKFYNS